MDQPNTEFGEYEVCLMRRDLDCIYGQGFWKKEQKKKVQECEASEEEKKY